MNQYKICVYAISKNEERFAERWMDSVGEADMVIVADTGSTDGTVLKLRGAGAAVWQEKIDPWRFDAARNAAMAHIPENTDICVSCDLDEVFEPGWRQRLEAAWTPGFTRARYTFVWSHNADGSAQKQFPMEKIHRRHGFKWVHPVHEVLEYSGQDEDKTVWIPGLILHHYPDLAKPRGQYLPLLELSARENPRDDRTMFWLGREYFYHKKYDLCIETLKKHLALPNAKWDEERGASMRFIGEAYEAKGDISEARRWLIRAIAECPGVREPYLKLARLAFSEANWPLCYAMAKKGLEITVKTGSYLAEPECRGSALYTLGAAGAYMLGLQKEGLKLAAIARQMNGGEA